MHDDAAARLRVEAAWYVLGGANAGTLRKAADQALDAGLYSDALAQLATEFKEESPLSDAGPVFERAMEAHGLPLPSRSEAVWAILRHAIRQIADGEIPPRVGLKNVVAVYYLGDLYKQSRGFVGDSHDLQILIGEYYGYDDLEDRPHEVSFKGLHGAQALAALEAQIVNDAKEWITRHNE